MNLLAPNLLILASAGSGKTFQLAHRVIGLVASGVAPEKIVALTFTRKAAGEFADAVLLKLAHAASHKAAANTLRSDLELAQADFSESLERVVRVLPRFTLGTMDSFFAKIVRGFQYELGLTGGPFDLLEGPRAVAAIDEILAKILGATLDDQAGENFLHAFRRASIGKEERGVLEGLRGFVKSWQSRYRAAHGLEWGPASLAGVQLNDWETRKHELYAKIQRDIGNIQFTRKGQREAFEKILETLVNHTIGSGSLNGAKSLLEVILQAAAQPNGPLALKYHTEFTVGGLAGEALKEMVNLAARCEMAAALIRTRAVRDVVAVFDAQCAKQLRRRGLLGFDDVKVLMGEWANNEDARLRREAVDFRLDARYEHWLLDEFQDTSRSDWTGLLPLMDEAAAANEGSMFIVGDRKQAIYAWRGGEVGLFDEVIRRYGSELSVESMFESWRSCPEVLALVNQVCGNTTTLRKYFGAAESAWEWQPHVSAKPLQEADKRGEARVEVVAGKWPERLERLREILTDLGVGERDLTCGVLMRSNALVREVADHLREAGFDVIEEGRREPAKDNPVGILLAHLLKWLANPADTFAWEVVKMSPLSDILSASFGEHWQQIWEGLLDSASQIGFAGMTEKVIAGCWEDWSDFGQRRAGDIIMALAGLDARGGVTPQQAADWIERIEVSQSPGIAAVQVMTIHKAKGLGFDVVIVPDVPNDGIPSAQYFDIAETHEWISETPPKWARDLIPEMREAETSWATSQRYEAFCMLYVALTRPKRGLYVLLEPPSATQDADKPSLANWLATSISSNGQPGIVYQSGSPDWVELFPRKAHQESAVTLPKLAARVSRRERITPSGLKKEPNSTSIHSTGGMQFGREVHAAFEYVGWIDETSPDLPRNEAGSLVTSLLTTPRIRPLFERKNRHVELFCEQPVDAILQGKWLSGVIDRIHLHRSSNGTIHRVEIIDFKTDAVSQISDLIARYSGQMSAYREAMAQAYPDAQIDCILISTRFHDWTSL